MPRAVKILNRTIMNFVSGEPSVGRLQWLWRICMNYYWCINLRKLTVLMTPVLDKALRGCPCDRAILKVKLLLNLINFISQIIYGDQQ